MVLNKRFRRNMQHNASFYISASLLTAIAVFAVITIYTAIASMDHSFQAVLKRGNVEDAQFTTLIPIGEADQKGMEETYQIDLEAIHYVDVREKNYTLRVFAPTQSINKYQMLEGEDINQETEVLLNRDFAVANKIEPGNLIEIAGKSYRVSGLAVRPDYLYAQKEPTDFYLDDAEFGQVTMSRQAFEKLDHAQTYYSIVFHRKNEMEVRKHIYDTYASLFYLSADSNNRISIARDLVGEYEIIVNMLLPVLFVMISCIVAIVLGRMVHREQKQIGALMAFGYRKGEIIWHYAVYAMAPAILGSVLGILGSVFLLEPVCVLFATDYEHINFDIHIHPAAIVISIFLPLILYMLTSIWIVGRLLCNPIVRLLSNSVQGNKEMARHVLTKSRLSFRIKFQLRALLANKSRTVVVIVGMFIGGFLCAFGFIFMDSCNYMVDQGLDNVGSYEYQYFLNKIETVPPSAGEAMLTSKFEVPGNKDLFFMNGLAKNQKYLNLSTQSKKPMEYGKYYITSNAAELYGVKTGDSFTFMQIQTMKQFTVRIEDIVYDNTQCALYTSMDNLADLLGLPAGSYNALVSDRELSLNKDLIMRENSKDTMREQLEFAVQLMFSIIYMLILLGAVICIICTYLTVNMLVSENKINISMLKVLGYRNREINALVLNTNHILLPVSFGLSIFACLSLTKKMFQSFIAEFNLYIEPIISVPSLIICFGVLTGSYFISLTILKRKVYRVNMVESLKDTRE